MFNAFLNKFNFKKYEKRPWGYYTVLTSEQKYLTKIIHVNPHQQLSLQSHNHRSEHWIVLSGKAEVILDEKEIILSVGESIDIPMMSVHSVHNTQDSELEILEVQMGEILSEDDIIRYQDIYGRV